MNNDEILREALERFRHAAETESTNREAALEDFRFRGLEQWPDRLRRARENDPDGPRPCLVVDKLNQYLNQVKNDQRQNRPSIKVRPVDDESDIQVADIYQGLIRHIEERSNADVAYDTAFEHAVTGGFGWFRVLTEYDDPMEFTQEIRIKRIRNPFTIYFDPNSSEHDGSDGRYAFVAETMSKEEFADSYPEAKEQSFSMAGIGDQYQDWHGDQTIRVAEYWCIRPQQQKIVLLSNGTVMSREHYLKIRDLLPANLNVLRERESQVNQVWWYKLTANTILDQKSWPGQWIPIIPVYGNEIDLEGKVIRSGLVRAAKDAQRAYNYAASSFIEQVSMIPKAPYIAAAEQIEQFENEWRMANIKNVAVLRYSPVADAPPPSRQFSGDIPTGWIQAMSMAEKDIQSSMGLYQAMLGAPSNEQSGLAILARQREGDVSTFHYIDNLTRSIRHLGRVLVDLIPRVYDSRRVIRILGEDGQPLPATIDPDAPLPVNAGSPYRSGGPLDKVFNLTLGRYDVSVSSGPSFTTRRQEAAAAMLQATQAFPQLFNIAGDILMRNFDWPGADQLAERLARIVPPEIKGDDASLPPEAQQLAQKLLDTQTLLQATQAQLATAQDLTAIERHKLEIDAYNAETNRLKLLQEKMDPDQIRLLVRQTLQETNTPSGFSPPGLVPPPEGSSSSVVSPPPVFPSEGSVPSSPVGGPLPINSGISPMGATPPPPPSPLPVSDLPGRAGPAGAPTPMRPAPLPRPPGSAF